MIGFGFMDNLVMIQAGDAIDSTIGVAFGLSTLTAAAYGQVVSDVSGTVFGSAVETAAKWLGLPAAGLTRAQCELRHVRVLSTTSAAVGVVMGCLMGMTSLLFMDLDKNERLKKQRELRTLFATLMEDGHRLIGAERCGLFLVDADGEHVFRQVRVRVRVRVRARVRVRVRVRIRVRVRVRVRVSPSEGHARGHLRSDRLHV